MSPKYWIFHENRVAGPYSSEDLRRTPGFTDDTLICPHGIAGSEKEDWQPARRLLEQTMAHTGGARSRAQERAALPPEPTYRDVVALVDLRKKVAHIEDVVMRLHEGLQQKDVELKSVRGVLAEKSRSISALERRLGELEERAADAAQAAERQKAELDALRAELIAQKQAQLLSLTSQVDGFHAEHQRTSAIKDELIAQLEGERDRLHEELRRLKTEQSCEHEIVERLRSESAELKSELEALRRIPPPPPAVQAAAAAAPGGLRVWPLLNTVGGPFLLGYSIASFNLALPSIANGLQTDMAGIAWAVVALPIAIASVSMLMGQIGSIFGPRNVFRVGLWIMSVSATLCGFSQSVLQLTLCKFFEGIGGSMMHANSRLLAVEAMPNSMARAQALVTIAYHAGWFAGCILSGFMIEHFAWRSMFFVMTGLGLFFLLAGTLSGVYAGPKTSSAPAVERPPIDFWGALLMFVASILVTILLNGRLIYRFSLEQRRGFMAVFAAAIAGFLVREHLAKSPLIKLGLFKIKTFRWSLLGLSFLSLPYGLLVLFTPFYLNRYLRVDFSYMGLAFSVQPIALVGFSALSGWWTDRRGPAGPAALGTLFLCIAMTIGMLLRNNSSVFVALTMFACMGCAMGLFQPALFGDIFGALDQSERWRANGFVPTVNHACTIIGTATATWLLVTDFKFVLGERLWPPAAAGFLETGIYSPIRTRIFTDSFVLSLNVASALGIACCLAAWLTILLRGTSQIGPAKR